MRDRVGMNCACGAAILNGMRYEWFIFVERRVISCRMVFLCILVGY